MRLFACFFFFNDTATTEIYTLSLHDALPIYESSIAEPLVAALEREAFDVVHAATAAEGLEAAATRSPDLVLLDVIDRKSTRLNSSHANISYAVFCLKQKTT